MSPEPRNPLYFFTLVGVLRLGLEIGSIVAGFAYVAATLMVFLPVIRSEEAALTERFGKAFLDYRERVPMLIPNLRHWQDVDTFSVVPSQLYKSARDSFVLVAVIPLFEFVDLLQDHGVLPVLLKLH